MMDGDDYRRRRRRRRRRNLAGPLLVLVVFVVVVAAAATFALTRGGSGHGQSAGATTARSPSPHASARATPRSTATPAPRPRIVADAQPVPILVYHHVLDHTSGGSPLLFMSTGLFRHQLEWLRSHGYRAVTLGQVYDAWTGRGTLPKHPVVLTFDDGYVDQARNAAPALRELGWPAVLDLTFSALYFGTSPPADRLTPEMVDGMLADGWELASHSDLHPDLTRLYGAPLRHELVVSKRRLRETFHVPVDFFCYPGGIYDRRIKKAVQNAGYLAAMGTRYGAATPRELYSLPRIYCYGGESDKEFGSRIEETLAAAAH